MPFPMLSFHGRNSEFSAGVARLQRMQAQLEYETKKTNAITRLASLQSGEKQNNAALEFETIMNAYDIFPPLAEKDVKNSKRLIEKLNQFNEIFSAYFKQFFVSFGHEESPSGKFTNTLNTYSEIKRFSQEKGERSDVCVAFEMTKNRLLKPATSSSFALAVMSEEKEIADNRSEAESKKIPDVALFNKIYNALYEGQKFARKGHNNFDDMKSINDYAKNNPNSRSAYALKLLNKYNELLLKKEFNKTDCDAMLCNNIHAYAYCNSWFGKSKLTEKNGHAFFKTAIQKTNAPTDSTRSSKILRIMMSQ